MLPVNESNRHGSPVLCGMLAVWAVFHSHQYAVHRLPEPGSEWGMVLGSLGLFALFGLSGYYVTGSYLQQTWFVYALRRIGRVWPALLLCVLGSVIGLSWLSQERFFWYNPQSVKFIWSNTFLGFLPMVSALPGVFKQNPLPMVNACLWPLPYVWTCYALLPLLWLRTLWPWWLCLTLLGGLLAIVFIPPNTWLTPTPYPFDWFYALCFSMVFFIGVALRMMPTSWHLIAGLYACVAIGFGWMVGYLPLMQWASMIVWTLGVVWLCTRLQADRWLARWGNPVYGMYLYGFTVQQVCYLFLAPKGFWVTYWVGLGLTLLLGYISWHGWEKHFIRWTAYPKQREQTKPLMALPSVQNSQITA
jgi:peptidoglycan/LPS O-acetylase OafA/YrhL